MNTQINLPASSNETKLTRALGHAQKSNLCGAESNEQRGREEALLAKEKSAEAAVKLMVATIFSILVVLFAWGEYQLSYPIYQVLFPAAPAICAGIIVAFGISASHCLRHRTRLEELEWTNYKAAHSDQSEHEARRDFDKRKKRELFWGWFIAVAITLLTLAVSWLRVKYEIADARRAEEFGFGVQDFMPMLCFVGEVFFGIYLFYFVDRIVLRISIARCAMRKKNYKHQCREETEIAYDYYLKMDNRTSINLPEDLRTAVYRHEHFNFGSEDYTSLRVSSLKVVVKDAVGNPVSNAIVTGRTEGNKGASADATGSDGAVALKWQDGSGALTCIFVNGVAHKGVFLAHQVVEIVVPEEASAQDAPTRRAIGFQVSD